MPSGSSTWATTCSPRSGGGAGRWRRCASARSRRCRATSSSASCGRSCPARCRSCHLLRQQPDPAPCAGGPRARRRAAHRPAPARGLPGPRRAPHRRAAGGDPRHPAPALARLAARPAGRRAGDPAHRKLDSHRLRQPRRTARHHPPDRRDGRGHGDGPPAGPRRRGPRHHPGGGARRRAVAGPAGHRALRPRHRRELLRRHRQPHLPAPAAGHADRLRPVLRTRTERPPRGASRGGAIFSPVLPAAALLWCARNRKGETAMSEEKDWKHDGVQVIKGTQLDPNTAQTPGMDRAAAINLARVGRPEDLGRHRAHPSRRQDRRPSPRPPRERHLRPQGQGPDALGRAARIHRRGRPRRFHLRAALRAAPGDQRHHRRDARMRAGAQRQRGGRRQPRHRPRPKRSRKSSGSTPTTPPERRVANSPRMRRILLLTGRPARPIIPGEAAT